MNSRVVELESVLSRATPDRREARQLAVELADTLDATTARRHVDRLLRCVTALTLIGSADAGEEILDAMLDLVEPDSDEATKVRDQRNRVATERAPGDTAVSNHHAHAPHRAAAIGSAGTTPHAATAYSAHRLIGGGTAPAAGNGTSPHAALGDSPHRPAPGTASPQPSATPNGAPPDNTAPPPAAPPPPATPGDTPHRPGASGTAAHRLNGGGTAPPPSGTAPQRPSPCTAPPNAHTGRAAAHAPATSTPRATAPHPPTAQTLGPRTPGPRRPDQPTATRPTAPPPPPRTAPEQFTRRYDPAAFHGTAGLAAIGVVPAPGFADPTAPPGRVPVLEAELRRITAAFGADDPRTVAALVNLVSARFQDARDRGSAEDAREAVEDLREAADRGSAALGPHHPKVLVARSNLASAEFELARVRGSAGQTQLALPALRAAADVTFAKLGPDDPHTLVAQASLAAAELEVARVEGAHTQARRALDTVRTAAARAATVHGSDHPASRLIVRQLQACEARTTGVGARPEDVRLPPDEAARLLSPARPAVPLTRDPTPQRTSATHRSVLATNPRWPADSLLGRLRDHTRQELLTVGTVVRYAADRELIEQDAHDTHAYLLLDGVVKVQVTDETGDTAVLAIRVAGDLVGEMAALDHRPRSATVVTCGDVVAKLITSAELVSFLHRRNDMFVELIAAIDDQLRWANKRRRDFLSHSAAERVARVLAELIGAYGREERGGWTLGIPLTKVELASIAGMKPRTAEKAFSDLRKAGVVVSHYRRDVLVPDLDHLRRFARMT